MLAKNDICVCLSLKAMIEQYWEKIGIALSKSSANLWVLHVQPDLTENPKKMVESGLPGVLLFGYKIVIIYSTYFRNRLRRLMACVTT